MRTAGVCNIETTDFDLRFGLLSAMAIFFVVISNIGSPIGTLNNLFNYGSFHMGLFMFISGCFVRLQPSWREFGSFILKKSRRLLVPFFAWHLIYGLIAVVLTRYYVMIFYRVYPCGIRGFEVVYILVGVFGVVGSCWVCSWVKRKIERLVRNEA